MPNCETRTILSVTMCDTYDKYKPLRNFLRSTDIHNSLGAIRWYINFLQLRNPQPQFSDLEVPREFINEGVRFIQPWLLTVLTRELIVNGTDYRPRYDLRRWKDMGKALNHLKAIEDHIGENYVNQGNILHYISKALPHQQFAWQENRPNYETETRYYHIYSDPKLRAIFEEVFGLDLDKFFLISLLLWNNFNQYLGFNYPPKLYLEKANITMDDYDHFLKNYALSLSDIQTVLKSSPEFVVDESFFHRYDSLRRYPLIFTEMNGTPTHVCPIPTYLFWRTTDGIYYDLVDALKEDKVKFDQFTDALGSAYSQYVGELLNMQPYNRAVKIVDADKVIAFKASKPDWFLIDNKSALFIECKTKRMLATAKKDFDFSQITESELKKLGAAVVQSYKAITDAAKREHEFLKGVERIFPIIVTLENWYIFGDVSTQLQQIVTDLMKKEGMDTDLLEKYPYNVVSSAELEDLLVVLREYDTAETLDGFIKNEEYKGWALRSYITKEFNMGDNPEPFVNNRLDEALERLSGREFKRGRIQKDDKSK
jgi:hypothetical protein